MATDVLERLSRAAREAAEAIRLSEMQRALEAVGEAVDAPQFVMCSFEESGRFVLQAGHGDFTSTFADYVSGIYAIDPLQERLMTLSRFPPIATHGALGVDVVRFRRSEAYQDYFRRIDVDRMLVCTLTEEPYGAPGAAGMMFTRPADRDDFSEDEAEAVAAVMPAFRAAVRRHVRAQGLARDRDRFATAASTIEAPRMLFDTTGRPVWGSDAAARWLGADPPADLVAAVARLGALASGDPLRRGTETRVSACLGDGRAVIADLTIVRTPGGEPLIEATLEPAGLGAGRLADAARHFGLTRAEATVLNALITGRSNAEVARALFVSLETVRTHVRRVLSKVGMSSRHDLAATVARALGLTSGGDGP